MATITIRALDDDMNARLRIRAARHGRSMEEEARNILLATLSIDPEPGTGAALVAGIRAWVEPFGGIELELPSREPMPEPPDFSGGEFDK
jgi:plasmid stability protein